MSILDQSLGQLARNLPGATSIFHKYHLNFCCGGKASLREAAAKHALSYETLISELLSIQTDQSAKTLWPAMTEAELIDHILNAYHDVHRQQLPELIRLAQRVESVHAGHPNCPTGLAFHLEHMQAELEQHMRKEEQILFPMIKQGKTEMAKHSIAMMRHEHEEHGEDLAIIDRMTHGFTLPKDACNTWSALYFGLHLLKKDLMDHVHLENNILFERIDGRLENANVN